MREGGREGRKEEKSFKRGGLQQLPARINILDPSQSARTEFSQGVQDL